MTTPSKTSKPAKARSSTPSKTSTSPRGSSTPKTTRARRTVKEKVPDFVYVMTATISQVGDPSMDHPGTEELRVSAHQSFVGAIAKARCQFLRDLRDEGIDFIFEGKTYEDLYRKGLTSATNYLDLAVHDGDNRQGIAEEQWFNEKQQGWIRWQPDDISSYEWTVEKRALEA